MAQEAQRGRAKGDVAAVAVSLDREKPALAGYAARLGKDWTVLCDYKGYDTRAAKDYGVKHLPTTFFLDGRGRIRLGDLLHTLGQDPVDDLRMEAFWAKRRGEAPGPPAPPSEPAAEVRWVFHLKSGGRVRAVSYEEKDGKYHLKLPAGTSTLPKEAVERIEPVSK